MAENTGISWAHHTFNPWWGCMQVSPACRFCYAKRDSARYGFNAWGSKGTRRLLSDNTWNNPVKWNRAAARSGEQARVFCASMADVFEDHPAVVDARARLWDLIERTPALTWMLLTKRPQNIAGMVPWDETWPGNVWLGVSAETQRFADERIPLLLQFPAAVRFVSAAPLLGPLDLTEYLDVRCQTCNGEGIVLVNGSTDYCEDCAHGFNPRVNWLITEGESGPKARPSHPDWFRSIRDQCTDADVAFHHKQWGEWVDPGQFDSIAWDDVAMGQRGVTMWHDGTTRQGVHGAAKDGSVMLWRVGKKAAGRLLDGELHDAFPTPHRLAVA